MVTLTLGGQRFEFPPTFAAFSRAAAAGHDLLEQDVQAITKTLGKPQAVVTISFAMVNPKGVSPESWAELFATADDIIAAREAVWNALALFTGARGSVLRAIGDKAREVDQLQTQKANLVATAIAALDAEAILSGAPRGGSPEPSATPASTA